MSKIKFCIFSDYHYWQGHYPNEAYHLGNILNRAADEKVDFVIQCGDFCHNAPDEAEFVGSYCNNKYGIPAFSSLGNHDAEDAESFELVCDCYNMKSNYEYYDINGFRIIILDTNYYMDDNGEYHHNPPRTHCSPGTRQDAVGEKQMKWLEEVIASAPGKCILFSHATFETDEGSYDAAKVREIINEANRKKQGSVILCCNGHYHRNSAEVVDNVLYFNVNAALNLEWKPEINPCFSEEFVKSADMAGNCCYAKDGLSAIVTVEDNGHIVIEGSKSEYLFNASPEKAGWNTTDNFGRKCMPEILNKDIFIK